MFEWKERTACLSHFDANRQKEAYALPLGQKAVGHGKTIHSAQRTRKFKNVQAKNSRNQINQKNFFHEIAFLAVFLVQQLIFGHF